MVTADGLHVTKVMSHDRLEARFGAMGRQARVVALGGGDRADERARHLIEVVERKWSRYRSGSEVSRVNDKGGHSVVVSPETYGLITRAVGAWRVTGLCSVLDTLAMARQLHPGQRNGLDALCKRYSVDNSHRELHGALLDADLLLEVYLAMTGGQGALILDEESEQPGHKAVVRRAVRPDGPLRVLRATEDERRAHDALLQVLDKASGGKTAWRRFEPDGAPAGNA